MRYWLIQAPGPAILLIGITLQSIEVISVTEVLAFWCGWLAALVLTAWQRSMILRTQEKEV